MGDLIVNFAAAVTLGIILSVIFGPILILIYAFMTE